MKPIAPALTDASATSRETLPDNTATGFGALAFIATDRPSRPFIPGIMVVEQHKIERAGSLDPLQRFGQGCRNGDRPEIPLPVRNTAIVSRTRS